MANYATFFNHGFNFSSTLKFVSVTQLTKKTISFSRTYWIQDTCYIICNSWWWFWVCKLRYYYFLFGLLLFNFFITFKIVPILQLTGNNQSTVHSPHTYQIQDSVCHSYLVQFIIISFKRDSRLTLTKYIF